MPPKVAPGSKIKVSEIKITDLSPIEKNASIAKLLPKKLHPYEAELMIDGINTSQINAIRRTCMTEAPAKCMFVDDKDFLTDNPFTKYDYTLKRIQNIPIIQSTPLTDVYSLNVVNDTLERMEVKASSIKLIGGKGGELPFNTTFTIAVLEPKTFLKLSRIRIVEGYGYNGAWFNLAFAARHIPQDIEMYDQYTQKGILSGEANPTKFKLIFESNGGMAAQDVIRESIKEIIRRLDEVSVNLEQLTNKSENYYEITLNGESDTIANMLVEKASEIDPDIKAITYKKIYNPRTVILRMYYDTEPFVLIREAITENKNTLNEISRQIR